MPVRPGVEIPDSLDSFIRECSKTYQSGYLYQANQDYINGIRTLPVDAHIPFLMGPYYDTPFTYSDDDLYQKLLGNNPTGNITDHYSEVSNGIAALTGEVIPACENCTVSTQNHYFSQELNTGSIDYAGDVLDIHDDTINFAAVDEFGNSLYDKDDDGIIDFVVFIHSGGAGEEGADNFFSHRYQFSEYNGQMYVTDDLIPGGGPNDYYRVNDYAIAAEMNGDGITGDDLTDIGPYCHELGHAFGLPDLYNSQDQTDNRGIGTWGLMGYGSYGGNGDHKEKPSHLCAWSKAYLGWIEVDEIVQNTELMTLFPIETAYQALRINIPNTLEYFLIENRRKVGFDEYLPNSGLLIWHIDSLSVSAWEADPFEVDLNGGGTGGVDLEEADGNEDLMTNINSGDNGDVFPGYEKVNLFYNHQLIIPNSNDNAGNSTNIAVTDIEMQGQNILLKCIVDLTPIANFECSTVNAFPYQNIEFYNMSTSVSTSITAWEWDFDNDGTIDSYSENPAAPYLEAGVYSVKLTVTDSQSQTDDCLKEEYIVVWPSEDLTISVPGDFPTIQGAIDAAPENAVITVEEGVYYENINFLGKNITVTSTYDGLDESIIENTIIDGYNISSVVTFENQETSSAVLDGFTLMNGYGKISSGSRRGGGIFVNSSNPTISNLIVKDSQAYFGGGIYCYSVGESNNCLELTNVRVESCFAGYTGGGVFVGGNSFVTMNNLVSTGNIAEEAGGGIEVFGSTVAISGGNITDNVVLHFSGGGLFLYQSDVELHSVFVSGNNVLGLSDPSDAYGGGVSVTWNSILFDNCVIDENESNYAAGGLYFDHTEVTFRDDNTVSSNTSEIGGGIYIDSSELLYDEYSQIILENNHSTSHGGGLYGEGSFILENLTVQNNSAGFDGGGLWIESSFGEIIVENGQIVNNTAEGSGGGICGSFDIRNSLILGNHSESSGGGISSGCLKMNKTVVANNTGQSVGGVSCGHYSFITNSTISNNSALDPNALSSGVGSNNIVTISNTLLWDNVSTNGIQIHASTTYAGQDVLLRNCDIQGGVSGITFSGQGSLITENILNADPLFADVVNDDYSLTWNGFPDESTKSPCIDSGTADYENDGQLDLEPDDYLGTAPDIGAFEFGVAGCTDEYATNFNQYAVSDDGSCICTDVIGDLDLSDSTDILDLVMLVAVILGQLEGTGCLFDAGNLFGDAVLDVLDVIYLVDIILTDPPSRGVYINGDVKLSHLLETISPDEQILNLFIAHEPIIEGMSFSINLGSYGYKICSVESWNHTSHMDFAYHIDNQDSTSMNLIIYDSNRQYLKESKSGIFARLTIEPFTTIYPLDNLIFTDRTIVNRGNDGQYLINEFLSYADYQDYICLLDNNYCDGCKDIGALNYDPATLNEDNNECVYLLGDLNSDGSLNVLDVVILNNIILEQVIPDEYQLFAADLNGDKEIDILDTQALLDLIGLQRSGGSFDEGDVYISTVFNDSAFLEEEMSSLTVNVLNETEIRLIYASIDVVEGFVPSLIVNGERTQNWDLQYYVSADSSEVSFILYNMDGIYLAEGYGPILEIGLISEGLSRNGYSGIEPLLKVQMTNSPDQLLDVNVVGDDEMTRIIHGTEFLAPIPESFFLHAPYPNPFNPITKINFDVSKESKVVIDIFDIRGRKMENLVSQKYPPGSYYTKWDASREASGVYLVRLETEFGFESIQKVLLLK